MKEIPFDKVYEKVNRENNGVAEIKEELVGFSPDCPYKLKNSKGEVRQVGGESCIACRHFVDFYHKRTGMVAQCKYDENVVTKKYIIKKR